MLVRYTTLVSLALMPFVAPAQPAASDVAYLRNRAIAEGDVALKVITHAVAAAATTRSMLTDAQRIAIQRAQHKILIQLVSRGLVVGNEINVQPDRSFAMRVFPDAIDHLAASADVAALELAGPPAGAPQ